MADLTPEEMAEWERKLAAEPRSALREQELARGLKTADIRQHAFASRLDMSLPIWRQWVEESGKAHAELGLTRLAEQNAKQAVAPPESPDHAVTRAAWLQAVESRDAARQRVADLVAKGARAASGQSDYVHFFSIPL